ncbi:hypothetical protein Dsin_022567 [Dipteronia sinensis]|uniref:Uncharacterized protein n=1 Tax=Dipteronia sinensis TaxID=43782 RepID=A0AAE0E196_9ROSI|nr:hypothetical protein Dsin_022567 [Dipteronia sinensis]
MSVLVNGSPTLEFGMGRGLRQVIFKMPVEVALIIEKFQRNFLWGDGRVKRKVHAVKWDEVCKSKHLGGLGIMRVLVKNNGMLAKWIWRFGKENDALWRRVIVAKYGIQENRLIWSLNNSPDDSFFVKTELKWDSRTLKDAFLRVFALAFKKSGPILEFGRWTATGWVWDVQTRRVLFDWEKNQWHCFQIFLVGISMLNMYYDALAWNLNRNGLYTVSFSRRGVEGI